jgi:hypothetical protein
LSLAANIARNHPDFSTLEKKKGAAEESLPRQEVETHS